MSKDAELRLQAINVELQQAERQSGLLQERIRFLRTWRDDLQGATLPAAPVNRAERRRAGKVNGQEPEATT